MSTPKVRFKGFTDDWEQRKLGDVIDDLKSGLSRELQLDDIGIPVVRANNVDDNKLDMKSEVKYWYKDDPQGANTSNYLIHKDDILINFINSEAKMGTAAIVEDEPLRDTIYTTNILRLRTNEELHPYFFLMETNLAEYKSFIKAITKPAVNQASFTTVDYKKYDIKIPNYKEQARIGGFFKKLENLITSYQRKCDELQKVKKYMLQKMFPKKGEKVPEIRFAGFTGDWEQRKIGDISEIVTGTTPSTKDKTNYDGDYLFVSPADIQGNRYVDETLTSLTEKGFSLGRKLRSGTSLFVSIGSTIGKVAQLRQEVTTNQQINAVIPLEKIDDNFVFTMLECIADNIKGLSATQAVPIINKSTFSDVGITHPTRDEQSRIGDYFSNLDNLITLHQRKHDTLKEIKKYMLQNMFPNK